MSPLESAAEDVAHAWEDAPPHTRAVVADLSGVLYADLCALAAAVRAEQAERDNV